MQEALAHTTPKEVSRTNCLTGKVTFSRGMHSLQLIRKAAAEVQISPFTLLPYVLLLIPASAHHWSNSNRR